MPITGQLWYTTLDVGDNQVAGYLNSDGTSITQVGPTANSALAIGVDTAAGFYFVANSDGTSISAYRISDNALIGTRSGRRCIGSAKLVNALAVDPINHVLFVTAGIRRRLLTGIVKISYNPLYGCGESVEFQWLHSNSGAQQFLVT